MHCRAHSSHAPVLLVYGPPNRSRSQLQPTRQVFDSSGCKGQARLASYLDTRYHLLTVVMQLEMHACDAVLLPGVQPNSKLYRLLSTPLPTRQLFDSSGCTSQARLAYYLCYLLSFSTKSIHPMPRCSTVYCPIPISMFYFGPVFPEAK